MKTILFLAALLFLTVPVFAFDPGSGFSTPKTNSHVGQNRGTPDGREGGETIETAIPILSLPFVDTGNTSDNIDNYDVACPFDGSTSPDVVYLLRVLVSGPIYVDMCGSGYDTKIYILDSNQEVVACNDDYYFEEYCGQYTSLLAEVYLIPNQDYYLVIDGYSGDSGDYTFEVGFDNLMEPPGNLECDGEPEGEPRRINGYVDMYNGGCDQPGGNNQIQALTGDQNGELVLCGITGWFRLGGGGSRDTDWYSVIVGATGTIEWTLQVEMGATGCVLGPNDCDEVEVLQSMTAVMDVPGILTIQGDPGDVVWLWVAANPVDSPNIYYPQFDYISTFSGLLEGVTPTDRTTFGGFKSLFR